MIIVHTFGGLSFSKDDDRLIPNFGAIISELFAYLAVNHQHTLSRAKIADLLWPEKPEPQSRSSLNTALWRLNTALKHEGLGHDIMINRGSETLRLDIAGAQIIDCQKMRQAVLDVELLGQQKKKLPLDAVVELTTAMDSYTGSFLPGLDKHWILLERERFHCLYIRGCTLLMNHYADRQMLELALSYGRRILQQDDLRENIHRQMIWLYVMNGQRAKALSQYTYLKNVLRKELDVEPMPETQSLYRHILQDHPNPSQGTLRFQENSADEFGKLLQQYEQNRASIYTVLVRGNLSHT